MTLLLEPPPVVDDATRRQFLAGLAAAGLLTGCGGSAEPPPAAEPATRTIATMSGPVSVPGRAERVAVVDGFTPLDTAVLLGAPLLDALSSCACSTRPAPS